ncbi:hypothetical protein K488DRAFT_57662 [Vararia minispora EC-137]|uniref:Uncharacterized protein n=1 Tax=Vararia minispora EC-137 TaxID=1314806 RepID=A0ACB8QAK5_9AGAM|nr:hypothetical protein K488DRAFT_57662 [Vararia minispora EC-137]
MKNSERLYVELIFGSSNKYASWDPEIEVKVGDYGHFTRGKRSMMFWRTAPRGIFLREGNIYDSEDSGASLAKKHGIPDPRAHGGSTTQGVTWITSKNAEEMDMSADVSGQTPALANCSVKASFKFSSGPGAVLTMDRDTITAISPPGALRRLLEDPRMKHCLVISEVHSCSSFARYLGNATVKSVTIGLAVEPPAGAVASASARMHWVRSTTVGNFKSRINEDDERTFRPLFRLVSLKEDDLTTGLRGTLEEAMQMPLPDAVPPWMSVASKEQVPEEEAKKGPVAKILSRLPTRYD